MLTLRPSRCCSTAEHWTPARRQQPMNWTPRDGVLMMVASALVTANLLALALRGIGVL